MSSLLYGSMSRRRLSSTAPLAFGEAVNGSIRAVGNETNPTKERVSHWQDALAALVPAEVLALHGVAMTLGTSTTSSGNNAETAITSPMEMQVVFWGLVVLAFALYLFGAKSYLGQDFLRAGIAAVAFVLWTMLQPSTAFDALRWDPSTLIRTLLALIGAALLGVAASALATKADKTNPSR
jgi:hypothetical protein